VLRPAPPVDAIPLLPEERAALVALLRALSDEQWGLTATGDWSVHDVALHLLGGELGLLARLRDGHAPGVKEPAGWNELVDWLDALNDSWLVAARRMSPHLTLDLLEWTGLQVVAYFANLDPYEPGENVSWASSGPAPNWLGAARHLTEGWVHQQQIRAAVGRPGLNDDRWVHTVLEAFLRGLLPPYRFVFAPEGTVIRIALSGTGGGDWALRREERTWVLLEGVAPEPDAGITLDANCAWRFLARDVDVDRARAAASTIGDRTLTDPFFESVSVIVRR
jgi:uncharacterized protein (TIGR03083 family)